MCKKVKINKKPAKRNNKMTPVEFKEMLSGLSDDEINRFYDLLLNLQQKP